MIRYISYAPFNILFVLSAFILSPFLAAISLLLGRPTLPGFLQWFSTLDDTLDGGQHQQPGIYPSGVTGFALWWQRTCWICRNPAHGWQARVLGFPTIGHAEIDGDVVGLPNGGFVQRVSMTDAKGRRYFSYRSDRAIGKKYKVKIWFGWNPKAYDGVSHHYEFQPFMIQRS